MSATSTLPGDVSYHIHHTPTGWQLVMQNAHCTLTQVFASRASARNGIETGRMTLDALTRQHLARRESRS